MFTAIIILCVALFMAQLLSPVDLMFLGVTDSSPLYTWLTYHWIHVDPLHLVINLLMVRAHALLLFKHVRVSYLLLIIIPAVLGGTFLCRFTTPTVGMSAIGYALVGIYSVLGLTDIFIIKKEQLYIYLFSVALSLLLPIFFATVNYQLHLISFSLSAVITTLIAIRYGRTILRC